MSEFTCNGSCLIPTPTPTPSLPCQTAESSRKWKTWPGFASVSSVTHISVSLMKHNSSFAMSAFLHSTPMYPYHLTVACLDAFHGDCVDRPFLTSVSSGTTAPTLLLLQLLSCLSPTVTGMHLETTSFPRTFQNKIQTP